MSAVMPLINRRRITHYSISLHSNSTQQHLHFSLLTSHSYPLYVSKCLPFLNTLTHQCDNQLISAHISLYSSSNPHLNYDFILIWLHPVQIYQSLCPTLPIYRGLAAFPALSKHLEVSLVPYRLKACNKLFCVYCNYTWETWRIFLNGPFTAIGEWLMTVLNFLLLLKYNALTNQ